MSDEVLDVDTAVAQRAAVLVRFGDLGLEGDDAFQARAVVVCHDVLRSVVGLMRRAGALGSILPYRCRRRQDGCQDGLDDASDPADLRRDYARAALDETTIAADLADPAARCGSTMRSRSAVRRSRTRCRSATVDAAGPSVVAHRAGQGDRRARRDVLHELRVGQGARSRRPAVRRRAVPLARARASGAAGRTRSSGCSDEETAAYFHSRPRGSQLGAWASPQSRVIESRAELEQALAEAEPVSATARSTLPRHWGGYLLEPGVGRVLAGPHRPAARSVAVPPRRGAWVLERLAP